MPEESLSALQREFDRLASLPRETANEQMVAFGQQLHATIHKSSGSTRLIRLLRFMSLEINRLGSYQLGAQGRVQQSFSEHGAIIAALRARDAEAAEAAMRRHVRNSAETAIRMLLGGRSLAGTFRRTGLPWTELPE